MAKKRICIVGGGWRADFFHRICRALPEEFEMAGASARSESTREKIAATWGVKVYETSEAMCDAVQPDFAINCGGWNTVLDVMRPLHRSGVKVLCETPPGWQVEQQEEMWQMVQDGLRMQVAEQGWLQPEHHARIQFANSGKLGERHYAMVSGGGYHGYSLIRKYLGIGFELPRIRAVFMQHPLVVEGDREGLATEEVMQSPKGAHVTLEFPDGKIGILDSAGTPFSTIRKTLVRVRGTHGELWEDGAIYLKDYQTPVEHPIRRVYTSDLDGHYLHAVQIGEEYYDRNDIRHPLTDDEIAIARSMRLMARYCDTGEEFYSFADAGWDQSLALWMRKAWEEGGTIEAQPVPWIPG